MPRSGLLFSTAFALWVCLGAKPTAAQTPVRYDFQVGQRVIYELRRERDRPGDGEPARSMEQVQFWCLQRGGDDALLVLEVTPVTADGAGPSNGTVLRLTPRGQLAFVDEVLPDLPFSRDALSLLPELGEANFSARSWTTNADSFGERLSLRREGRDDEVEGTVRYTFETLGTPCGVAAARGRFWFDGPAGHIVRLERESIRPDGATADRLSIRRFEVRSESHTWCGRQTRASDRFLQTQRTHNRLLDSLLKPGADAQLTLTRLDKLWADLDHELSIDRAGPFTRIAAGRRAFVRTRYTQLIQRAALAGQWAGTLAAEWSLQDLSGVTHKSEEYRDRTVIECFWSAASPDSLRALEHLRRISGELDTDKCRIICLNTDSEVGVASRAIRECGEGLTHLLAGPPVGAKSPPELPVWRVLEKGGKVREVFFGWDPSLENRLRRAADAPSEPG